MFNDIETALRKHLATLSGNHKIIWEGLEDNYSIRAITLVPINIPNNSTLLTTDKDQENPGVYRIIIHVPTNQGTKKLLDKIDDIVNHYGENLFLYHNNVEVSVLQVSRGVTIRERGCIVCNVDINYVAYTSNIIL